METTYTVKAKSTPDVWIFKYHLNGVLASVEFLNVELSEKQINWLFLKGNFPYIEAKIKHWQTLKSNFEITVGTPVYTFEALWNLYNNKVKRFEAEKSFKKLKQDDIIKCFMTAKPYDKYIGKKGIAKAHLSTFINQRYFEDDWQKAI